MDITLQINQNEVYKEVAKTTSYTGAKSDDVNAYDRIYTQDEDREMLQRFWDESKNTVANNLKRVLQNESDNDGIYILSLELSSAFDPNLTESMRRSLFSFFVMNIISKWYAFINKDEATNFALEATTFLDDVLRKAFFKRRPTRPTYND